MNPILKGFLISISIIIGFLLVNFAIVAFLSEVLNDQNSPWIFLIVMGVGMPIIVITRIITGLYKYFKLKSKVGIGLILGPIVLGVLFQFAALLNFIM